ncbi:alpha/beta hydrolase [Mariniphaga sp.]|uniref:alpha/beta hydrolase n=1 Tax=Mariniphaga sp. TaxID=1954475 RepID=UPI003566DDFB
MYRYSGIRAFLLVVTFIFLGFSFPSKTQQNQLPEKTRYLDRTFKEVDIQKDIKFAESVNEKGELENLKLDIYTPQGDEQLNRPVILWIHGGGFRPGNDKSQSYIVELVKRFSMKGYVGLSIDYRIREQPRENPEETIFDAVEDAGKALVWLRENAEMLKIDPSKIIVAGGSAGGILGTNLCLNDNNNIPGVDNSGIIAFVNLWGSPSAEWGEPVVDENDPPTIIIHGTEDELVAYDNSVKLKAELDKNNVRNELVTITGAGHTPVKHMDGFEVNISRFLFEIIQQH